MCVFNGCQNTSIALHLYLYIYIYFSSSTFWKNNIRKEYGVLNRLWKWHAANEEGKNWFSIDCSLSHFLSLSLALVACLSLFISFFSRNLLNKQSESVKLNMDIDTCLFTIPSSVVTVISVSLNIHYEKSTSEWSEKKNRKCQKCSSHQHR